MKNERLVRFLDRLESLSATPPGPEAADAVLRQIHNTILTMKDEVLEDSSEKSLSTKSSNSDNKFTVESVEVARSGLASTIAIDDNISAKSPTPGSLGFIDAIKLAALGIENDNQREKKGSETVDNYNHSRSDILAQQQDSAPLLQPEEPQSSKAYKTNSSNSSNADYTHSEPQTPSGNEAAGSLISSQTSNYTNQPNPNFSRRIKYFNKCFPAYRKLYTYETQPRSFLRTKNYNSFCSALSPDTLHMGLVSPSKYQIYEIPENYNDKPRLKFTGETGFHKGDCWVSMNNLWLVAASFDGNILVASLKDGRILLRRNLKYQITALEVSSEGSYIGIALIKTSLNDTVTSDQPLIYLLCPSIMISPTSAFEHLDVVSFSSPYQDKIQTLSFNDGETAMICSTKSENRIFVVSLADYREPKILMRSRRNQPEVDGNTMHEDRQPEGITGTKFLPNIRYILLCSQAPNSPPVVLDTKLTVCKGKSPTGKVVQYLKPSGQQQAVVIRFEKMGSAIQTCATSPRGNGAAFVDYSGAVYVVNLPTVSTESRKIAVGFNLTSGNSLRTVPAFRFSPDGTSLIAVDRKGDVHIADFGAGYPQQPGIMKTKVLS